MRGKIWLCVIIALLFNGGLALAASKTIRDKNKDLADLKRITEQVELLLTSNNRDINQFGKLLGIKLIKADGNQYYNFYQAYLPPSALFQTPDIRMPKDKNKIPFIVLGVNKNAAVMESDVQSTFGKADRIEVPTPEADIKINWVYKRPGGYTSLAFDKSGALTLISFHYDD